MIPVRGLLGISRVPTHRTSASEWLQRHGTELHQLKTRGGMAEFVRLSDLPEPERLAYLRRELEGAHLPPGTYDDEAHSTYLAASPNARSEAERRAGMVRTLKTLGHEVGWPERLRLVRERFGEKGVSKPTLKRHLRTVEGVDPINYAPALLPCHKGGGSRADTSRDAWRCFVTILRDANDTFPLRQAWRDVRDIAKASGWHWPSFPTIYRRWQALTPTEQMTIRQGRDKATKALTQIRTARQDDHPPFGVGFDGRSNTGFLGGLWRRPSRTPRHACAGRCGIEQGIALGSEQVRKRSRYGPSDPRYLPEIRHIRQALHGQWPVICRASGGGWQRPQVPQCWQTI